MDDRIRLVCVPSTDPDFADHARGVLDSLPLGLHGEPRRIELERRLREAYPGAVVRVQDPLASMGGDEVTWYATNRAYRTRIATSLEIAAPPELVFDVYVHRFPEWQVAVRVRPLGVPNEIVGTEFGARYEIFGRSFDGRFTIVDADPPHSVRLEASGGGIHVWYAASFVGTGSGTRVTVVGDYELPTRVFPRVQRVVLGRVIRRDIDRAHAALKRVSEDATRADRPGVGVKAP